MTDPSTAAGRALIERTSTAADTLNDILRERGIEGYDLRDWAPHRSEVAAIEAEARAEGHREAVREIRDGLPVAVLATDGGPALAYAMRVTAYIDTMARLNASEPRPTGWLECCGHEDLDHWVTETDQGCHKCGCQDRGPWPRNSPVDVEFETAP